MTMRARILVLVLGVVLLVVALAGVPLAIMTRNAVVENAETEAQALAENAADFWSTNSIDSATMTAYLARLNNRSHAAVSLVTDAGTVIGADLNPDLDAAVRADQGAQTEASDQSDFDDDDRFGTVSPARIISADQGPAVTLTASNERGVATAVAQVSQSSIDTRVRRAYLVIAGAGLALLAVAGAAAEVTTRRLVKPLAQTARTAERLSSGDLHARAPVDGPAEVSRVALELNALAERIDELLAREREDAADLSHRLRTPLTAVRLWTEAMPPGPTRDELEAAVAELERTLTQVIRAARRSEREGAHPRSDAAAITRERSAFWVPLAEDQGRQVSVDIPVQECWTRLTGEDLAAVVDALIENVIAHTPEGTALRIVLHAEPDEVVLDVLDRGPGIAVNSLIRGRSDRGSSGLGLDIARATAESVGGRLEIVASSGTPAWTGVRLHLPATDGSR